VDYGSLQAEIHEFPCIFPRNREKAHRDEFADDCLHRSAPLRAMTWAMCPCRASSPHRSVPFALPLALVSESGSRSSCEMTMYVRPEVIMPFMRDRAIASGCSREDQQHCISHLAACSKQGIRWFHGGILITVAPDFDGRASGGESRRGLPGWSRRSARFGKCLGSPFTLEFMTCARNARSIIAHWCRRQMRSATCLYSSS